jgi:membrane associated rhomboid family serine protease
MTWRPEWEEEAPRRGFGFGGGVRGWGVARTMVALCILVTVVGMILHRLALDSFDPLQPDAARRLELSYWLGLRVTNALWFYPWFTYVFAHDPTSIQHILFNGLLLWFLGVDLEDRLGRGRFLTLFFGAALVGAAAHVLVQALVGRADSALIGASGGLFGLLFYVARETPNRPFVFWIVPVPAKVLAGIFLIYELFPLITDGFGGGIAHLCHLGGAAFGLLWYRWPFDALARVRVWSERFKEQADVRQQERAAADDQEMDRLLRKIHEEGMPSLTARERDFLQERSRGLRDRGR